MSLRTSTGPLIHSLRQPSRQIIQTKPGKIFGLEALGLALLALALGCDPNVIRPPAGGKSGSSVPDGGVSRAGGQGGSDTTADAGGSRGEEGPALPADSPCTAPAAVDVTRPTTMVGTGTPESCTELAFASAIQAGGIITFDCGEEPFTLILTAQKPITRDTIIDGDGRITLSGGQETRLFAIHGGVDQEGPSLTLQNLTVTEGLATEADAGGAAIFRRGGRLAILGCHFLDNRAAREGQGVTGGAIASIGGGETVIVRSSFVGNIASNGGALGSHDAGLTLIDTTFTENQATGGDLAAERGGNGGAVFLTGSRGVLSICRSRFARNRASASGGALYHRAEGQVRVQIDRSTLDQNFALPEGNPGVGGGAYLQGVVVELTRSTISNNRATSGGGLHLSAQGQTELRSTNVTIAHNRAISGAGGGLVLGAGVKASLLNVTVAGNGATPGMGAAAGAAGIVVETADAQLTNSIVASNSSGEERAASNCSSKMASGGGNVQYPSASDTGGALCADGVVLEDPGLDELSDNGGPTLTIAVPPDSPAVGVAHGCPSTDQRGEPRTMPCTAGAFERR